MLMTSQSSVSLHHPLTQSSTELEMSQGWWVLNQPITQPAYNGAVSNSALIITRIPIHQIVFPPIPWYHFTNSSMHLMHFHICPVTRPLKECGKCYKQSWEGLFFSGDPTHRFFSGPPNNKKKTWNIDILHGCSWENRHFTPIFMGNYTMPFQPPQQLTTIKCGIG